MNSTSLLEGGFKKFGVLKMKSFKCKENKECLGGRGVYVFISGRKFPRLIGATDILYIGHAGGSYTPLYSRVADYCRKAIKSGGQDKRIHDALDKLSGRKIYLFYKTLSSKKESREEERRLLEEFVLDHLESPPLNRSV